MLRFSENVEHARRERAAVVLRGQRLPGHGRWRRERAGSSSTVTEKPPPDSGATPAVTYTRDGVEDVRDAAANLTPPPPCPQSTDGARPVLLSAPDRGRGRRRPHRPARLHLVRAARRTPTTPPPRLPSSASGFSVARVRGRGRRGPRDRPDRAGRLRHRLQADPHLPRRRRQDPRRRRARAGGADVGRPDGRRAQPAARVGHDRRHATSDGELDSIAVRFSESVVHAQEATPGSFTAGAFTISSAEAATGDTVELKLQQSGTGDTGVRPAVGYTPDAPERRARPGGQLRRRRIDRRRRPTARGRCCSRQRPPTSTTTASWTASDELVGAAGPRRRQRGALPGLGRAARRRARARRGGADARRGPGRAGRARHRALRPT